MVFKLRKGVTFHNGKPVTAEDVVASFTHHRGADSKSAAKSLLEAVTAIKADGAETVIFELASGNADFPYIASDYHIPILPRKEDGTADWESGIRTGPYVLDKFEPGVSCTLNKNPNYFKSDKGWFDALEFFAIKDVTARTNALNTGETQYLHRADLKTLDLLKQNPNVAIFEKTGYGHYIYVMNVTAKPFDNQDVRNAIKYFPRPRGDPGQGLQRLRFGRQRQPDSPTVKFAVDPQPKHVYDPEMSKSLLKKAGLESLAFDLSVSDAAFTGAVDAALLWKERAKACGIDINVIREPDVATGTMSGSRSPSWPPTGRAAPPATGCSPPPMRPTPPGTTRSGRTRASTSFWWRPVPRPTRPSARPCMRRCSSSCTPMAAW